MSRRGVGSEEGGAERDEPVDDGPEEEEGGK